MTDFDLERLGDVWRQDPDPAEIERLRRSAEGVARRAQQAQIAEATLAVVVSGVVLVLALSNPRPATLLVGAMAIALMLSSSIRQRKLRRLELKGLTGSTENMLDQSIARLRATLKRAKLALFSVPPGLALGLGFGAALDGDGGSGRLARATGIWWSPHAFVLVIGVLLISMFAHYYFVIRRNRNELERLIAMREVFSEENRDI